MVPTDASPLPELGGYKSRSNFGLSAKHTLSLGDLPLGVLRGFAGALKSILLALLDPRITR